MSFSFAWPLATSAPPRTSAQRAPTRSACLNWRGSLPPRASRSQATPAFLSRDASVSDCPGPLGVGGHEEDDRAPLGRGPPARLDDQREPLLPQREADARRRRAAQRLDQPVVAPAAGHGRLGPERVARELEGGPDVVVEPADEPAVDGVRDPERVEPGLHRVEVGGAAVAEPIEQARRLLEDRLAGRDLAVEHAQRVPLDPLVAVRAELLLASRAARP